MKIENLGANHQIIENDKSIFLASYGTIICKVEEEKIYLDSKFWNYSSTTSKYRNKFLKEDTKTTETKLKQGIYFLTNLN